MTPNQALQSPFLGPSRPPELPAGLAWSCSGSCALDSPLAVPADIAGALPDLHWSPLGLSACKCGFGSSPFLRNQKLGPRRTSGGQIHFNCGKTNSHDILFKRFSFNLTLRAFPGELLRTFFPPPFCDTALNFLRVLFVSQACCALRGLVPRQPHRGTGGTLEP